MKTHLKGLSWLSLVLILLFTSLFLNEMRRNARMETNLFEQRLGRVGFKVNPYLCQYFDRDLEIGLREAYMDMYFGQFDLRVGKQQIIYGKAEGVFITDVVSPKDLNEFLLHDFDEMIIHQ